MQVKSINHNKQRDNARTTSVAKLRKYKTPWMLASKGVFLFAQFYSAPARHEQEAKLLRMMQREG